MSQNNDMLQYDEEEAVRYIQNYLPQEMKEKITADDINYVIDVVYDFYETKGLLDEDVDDETTIEIDEDEMMAYIMKSIRKDKYKEFADEEVMSIVQGELAYCDSLGIFE